MSGSSGDRMCQKCPKIGVWLEIVSENLMVDHNFPIFPRQKVAISGCPLSGAPHIHRALWVIDLGGL